MTSTASINRTNIPKPYIIFMGDNTNAMFAKTGAGLRDWAKDDCVGQLRLTKETTSLDIPDLSLQEAIARGAKTLVIGSSPIGGSLPAAWIPHLRGALQQGLNIASGMHQRVSEVEDLSSVASKAGTQIFDVRHTDFELPIATGRPRSGKRLLTVGTDCALGKKYTCLTIWDELRSRGIAADFRATGQTGILISGAGIAIDGVKADFITGAAELLSPDAAEDHWDVIEGQGSLFHPAYSGVTLGLVHGSQPDVMVLCHNPTLQELGGFPGFPVADLHRAVRAYEEAASLTNPRARVIAISLRTDQMDARSARKEIDKTAEETGYVCVDPIRDGVSEIVDLLEKV